MSKARWLHLLPALLLACVFMPAAEGQVLLPHVERTAEQDQRLAELRLRQNLLHRDFSVALPAMKELLTVRPDAGPEVDRACRAWYGRMTAQLNTLARSLGPAAAVVEVLDEVERIRKLAWDNIRTLDKGEPVQRAHEYFKALEALHRRLDPMLDQRAGAVSTLVHFEELLTFWRQQFPESAQQIATDEQVDALRKTVHDALGMTLEEAKQCATFDGGKGPTQPLQRALWFHLACKRIDAWNQTLSEHLGRGELENAVEVNVYRRYLGAMPYEIDIRLVQAARRHSKEMQDLGFFAHDSPTEANRSHVKRMANAGYTRGAYSENIAMGYPSGSRAFRGWFDSPGHHKNMVNEGSTQLGVGRWGRHWTQNMGRGKRLMLMDETERESHMKIVGDVLPPQR